MSAILKSAFAATLLVTSCFVAPAYGQSKKDLAALDAAMAERLARLESRMLTGDPAAERLMARIDALESSQRALRGELERITFERDGLWRSVWTSRNSNGCIAVEWQSSWPKQVGCVKRSRQEIF